LAARSVSATSDLPPDVRVDILLAVRCLRVWPERSRMMYIRRAVIFGRHHEFWRCGAAGRPASLGPCSLDVMCRACNYRTVINVDSYSDDTLIPCVGARMHCSQCGRKGASGRPDWAQLKGARPAPYRWTYAAGHAPVLSTNGLKDFYRRLERKRVHPVNPSIYCLCSLLALR
jgi:hypothetical protein